MKRIIILALVIFGSHSLSAQSIPQTDTLLGDKKQTISLSYSPVAMSGKLLQVYLPFSFNKFDVVLGEFGVKGVVYEPQASGLFTIAYGRTIEERVTLRFNLSYQQIWRKWDLYVDAYSPHYYTERFHFFQIMPEVRYDYVKRKNIALFLSGGIGLNYLHNTRGVYGDVIASHRGLGVGFQIWLFGLEVEPIENFLLRMNFLGFGTIGVLEFGLGYRF